MRIRLVFLLMVCAILAPGGSSDFAFAQTHAPDGAKWTHDASHQKLPSGQTGSAKTGSAPLRSVRLKGPAQNNGNTMSRGRSGSGARNGTWPSGNLRHLSPNAAVLGGPASANSKGTATIDGRRMGRKP
jgi:hypothetical protein